MTCCRVYLIGERMTLLQGLLKQVPFGDGRRKGRELCFVAMMRTTRQGSLGCLPSMRVSCETEHRTESTSTFFPDQLPWRGGKCRWKGLRQFLEGLSSPSFLLCGFQAFRKREAPRKGLLFAALRSLSHWPDTMTSLERFQLCLLRGVCLHYCSCRCWMALSVLFVVQGAC